jgi:hypothetical protein
MPLPPNFYSSYNKGIIKDTRFYYSYNIRFNINSPFAFKLEAPIAIYSTRPINNININPSNMPITLKLINLAIAAIDAGLLFINNYLAKSTIEKVSTRP